MSKLFIVPTPVGNLGDMTLRAIETLKSVDLILAEDTRTSSFLLKHFGIERPLQSHHLHNEHKMVERIAERIAAGQSIALISDAGTPAISDPGFLLVRACVRKGISVECLPGPTALIPALVVSGLPCDRFFFEGFLPPKKGRQKRLAELAALGVTVVFYESPYRVKKLMEELTVHFGPGRPVAVVREISKKFEEIVRGTAAEVATHYAQTEPRGEFVVVVGPVLPDTEEEKDE